VIISNRRQLLGLTAGTCSVVSTCCSSIKGPHRPSRMAEGHRCAAGIVLDGAMSPLADSSEGENLGRNNDYGCYPAPPRWPPPWISRPPTPDSRRSLRRETYPPLLHHHWGHDHGCAFLSARRPAERPARECRKAPGDGGESIGRFIHPVSPENTFRWVKADQLKEHGLCLAKDVLPLAAVPPIVMASRSNQADRCGSIPSPAAAPWRASTCPATTARGGPMMRTLMTARFRRDEELVHCLDLPLRRSPQ
jgi:hypothetical protein